MSAALGRPEQARPEVRSTEGRPASAAPGPGVGVAGAATSGAQWLLEMSAASGIEVCFANPGTTELPFVAAMDKATAVRPVLNLFEGVCSGAADGYYRIRRKPAMTLTHLGPGFANAIANLHNARRARSSIFNVIGEHMSWHVQADPPLASDIESLARPVSAGVWRASTSAELQTVSTELLGRLQAQAGIQTLILPMDVQEDAVDFPVTTAAAALADVAPAYDAAALERVARAIAEDRKVLLYLGSGVLRAGPLTRLAPLLALSNVEVMGETFPAVSEHGLGLPSIKRLPHIAERAHPFLSGFDCVALIDVLPPVAFFGARGQPSFMGIAERMAAVCAPGGAGAEAIDRLVEAVGARALAVPVVQKIHDAVGSEQLTADAAARIVAAHLPANAIVSAEGATLGFPFNAYASQAERHSTIVLTGGAIGQGLPSAFGAAIAAPDRKVVALQSDGSALYTVQALWSMARENTDVVVVLASNRRYDILINEMARNGYQLTSEPVRDLLSLAKPAVDWLALSSSFGVPAHRAETVSAFRDAFVAAMRSRGPVLIEVVLP